MSMTLAQAYNFLAVSISMIAGGTGMMGEIGPFYLNSISEEYANQEILITFLVALFMGALFVVTKVWMFNEKKLREFDRSNAVPYVAMFFGAMAGLIIGRIAGFYAIFVPLCISWFALSRLNRLESIVATAVTVTAIISTIFGLESGTRTGFPTITVGEPIWVSLLSGYLGGVFAAFLTVLIHRYFVGYGAAIWTGAGVASISLIYFSGRYIFGETTIAMGIVLIFWTILPLANVVGDYLSLGISHMILRRIVAVRDRSLISIVGYGFLDLIIAVLLTVLSVLVIPAFLTLGSSVVGADLQIEKFVTDSAADLSGHGLWLGSMVLSTLVWTTLHFFIVVLVLSFRVSSFTALNVAAVNSIASDRDSLMVKLYLSSRWGLSAIVLLCGCNFFVWSVDTLVNHIPAPGGAAATGIVGYLEMLALFVVRSLTRVLS